MGRGMIVRFVALDGSVRDVAAAAGERLLDAGQRDGQPLEGTCGGAIACSTCHVVIAAEDWPRLPPANEEEEDLLDLARDATRFSRLACQVILTPALDGLTARIPGGTRNG